MADVETVSTPTTPPVTAGQPRPVAAGDPAGTLGAGPNSTGAAAPVGEPLTDADFRKDGELRKATINRIEEETPARGGSRSYNEITDETTVVSSVGGKTVTYTEAGDTRDKGHARESGMDSMARAMDNANEAKE